MYIFQSPGFRLSSLWIITLKTLNCAVILSFLGLRAEILEYKVQTLILKHGNLYQNCDVKLLTSHWWDTPLYPLQCQKKPMQAPFQYCVVSEAPPSCPHSCMRNRIFMVSARNDAFQFRANPIMRVYPVLKPFERSWLNQD